MTDLFDNAPTRSTSYSAKDIEVLEGLEPIRRHPGMYIGGTDEHAMHHLVTEILDNAMDEAVAGHASRIELIVESDGWITVNDNGRGIPTGKHPRFPGKSALEVIMTTLHAGGKFKTGAYTTSGGLHGVGASVVNALSDHLEVEVARDRKLYRQAYKRGAPTGPLEAVGPAPNRRGTRIRFHPDPEIFGSDPSFKPERLFRLARSKAFLFSGVTIRWRCDPQLIRADAPILEETEFHFPGGLYDFLETVLEKRETLTPVPFHGRTDLANGKGRLEWAIAWPMDGIGFTHSYCNTVSTPQGGTHEAGLRAALLKGLKAYADLIGNKHASSITADDVLGEAGILLSVFLSDPTFQGQTKEKLTAVAASRWVESALRDRFDHWMAGDPTAATALLENAIDRAEARKRKKADTGTIRKSATRRLRLPGKLADCSQGSAQGTEIFIVEGDSAGGSAKQARNRQTQAILPLRGKILNVASASADKIRANQELTDLVQALGCGMGKDFDLRALRYERIVIMTDADVDGAHIASLLITFFYRKMPGLIQSEHLYLAQPPLYRLTQGSKTIYAHDDEEKTELMEKLGRGKGKIDVARFKGLGEMPPRQLKETTMDPSGRILMRVVMPKSDDPETALEARETDDLIERLMGRKAETRFQFIQENARFVRDIDV